MARMYSRNMFVLRGVVAETVVDELQEVVPPVALAACVVAVGNLIDRQRTFLRPFLRGVDVVHHLTEIVFVLMAETDTETLQVCLAVQQEGVGHIGKDEGEIVAHHTATDMTADVITGHITPGLHVVLVYHFINIGGELLNSLFSGHSLFLCSWVTAEMAHVIATAVDTGTVVDADEDTGAMEGGHLQLAVVTAIEGDGDKTAHLDTAGATAAEDVCAADGNEVDCLVDIDMVAVEGVTVTQQVVTDEREARIVVDDTEILTSDELVKEGVKVAVISPFGIPLVTETDLLTAGKLAENDTQFLLLHFRTC